MRRPCSFRETDVRRAIKAARSSGIEIGRVEIERDGRIIVIPGKPSDSAESSSDRNEWDDVR